MIPIMEKDVDIALKILFSRILDPVAIYRVRFDENGNFVNMYYIDVNSAYEAIMKVKRNDVLGKSFEDVWSKKEENWKDIIIQVASTGIYARYEGYSFDTSRHLYAIAFSPQKDVVAVIFMDMTHWKNAEKALMQKEKLLTEYRAELRKLATELSLAEEKTRHDIAVNLHDRVGYSLISLLSEFREIVNVTQEEKSPLEGKIIRMQSEVESLLKDIRSMTFEISSPLLYEVGLEAALEALAQKMLSPRNIYFDFQECGPKAEISLKNRILIYQMAQELLLNVIKHSEAKNVRLRVQRGKKRVRVVVEDDGIGLDVNMNVNKHWGKNSGIGLFSIRERLHFLGGELSIISGKGEGCSIAITAPIETE